MSKPVSGTLVWRSKSWQVRIRTGETDVYIDLETTDEGVARRTKPRAVRKYLSGLATKTKGTAVLKVAPQTVSELAAEYYDRRKESGVKNARGEKRWFELHIEATLGSYQPKSVSTDDVERLLLDCKKKGLSKESTKKVRAEISRLWNHCIKCNAATVNVGELADMPRMKDDPRPRQQLTNEEFLTYLNWPDELGWTEGKQAARKAKGETLLVSREVKTLAVVARCVGGARTSDLHALIWEAIDTQGWASISVFRPKGQKTDRYELPSIVVPTLRVWWTDHKCPVSGPVFPTRSNGGRARADGTPKNGAKQKMSYAKAFRRDLLTAGIDRAELHRNTATSLQIDFHSMRRGFISAVLHDTDTDTRASMALAGHGKGSMATHMKYDTRVQPPMIVPPAALPQLPALTSGPANDDTKPETNHETAVIWLHQHGRDDTDGTKLLELLKQLSPENLQEFSGLMCCGADGTRTRGLRRDRPAL